MSKPTYFRRCHICGAMNESEHAKVERCDHCNKGLAPFYYFDDRFTAVQGDLSLRPPLLQSEYFPIQGLTVYWESF